MNTQRRASSRPRISRRTLSVTLLSFSSGLPLGLVWIAIPDWMRAVGVDIRLVGLFTLAQAPWSFKVLWSPLMDRFALPGFGRRRGWMVLSQIALGVLTLSLAGVGDRPETPWVVLALACGIAFAGASQDIVIDAYAVDVLHPDEHGVAVGARTAAYRVAMLASGALAIPLAARISWPAVSVVLAALYLPMLAVSRLAPEPERTIAPPATLREALWLPFLGFMRQHRALEILAFVLLYKLADNLAQSLRRPFLNDMGYSEMDRGAFLGAVELAVTVAGTFIGGAATVRFGLGHVLWLFGALQILSNLGFVVVATQPVNLPMMLGTMGFESLASGLGMGAFGVLLLRLTEKRFSATQYALFSSLFGLPRLCAGPITGFAVHALGWTTFFWLTLLAGIPGLAMLWRFVPPGTRDVTFTVEPPRTAPPLSQGAVRAWALAGGVVGFALAVATLAGLAWLEALPDPAGTGVGLRRHVWQVLVPESPVAWLAPLGAVVFGSLCGLLTAAVLVARQGAGSASADG